MKKGLNEKEGPFVKRLDSALQEIGVQPQQYFGGAFIGNHVHTARIYILVHRPMVRIKMADFKRL